MVERRALIRKRSVVGEYGKAVRETFGYPEMALVCRTQHRCRPAPEGRRAVTDIDRNIVNLTFEHADELALRIGPLIMQAAQHAMRGARHIGLHETQVEPRAFILFRIVTFVEKTARVAEYLRL